LIVVVVVVCATLDTPTSKHGVHLFEERHAEVGLDSVVLYLLWGITASTNLTLPPPSFTIFAKGFVFVGQLCFALI